MFKILSDPTKDTVTEVDLSSAGASVSFLQGVSWGGKDIVNERPDGGSVVFSRRARSQVQLNILKGLSQEDWQKVVRMRNNGEFVEVGPNWDTSTVFYAPLGDSTKALVRNYPNRGFVYDDGTYTGMGQARKEFDSESTRFTEVPANTPRFIRSNLGKGIYLADGLDNVATNDGHSTDVTQIWSVLSGAGFVDFVGWESSPADGFDGVTRIKVPSSTAFGVGTDLFICNSVESFTINDVIAVTMWVKGRGVISNVQSQIGINALDTKQNIPLSSEWQEITFKGVAISSGSAKIRVDIERDDYEQEVLIGPVSIVRQNSSNVTTMPVAYWDGSNTAGSEKVTYASGPSFPQDEMTLTIMGLIPDPNENSRWVDALETSTRNVLGMYEGQLRFIYASVDSGDSSLNINTGITADDVGKPFWICARAKIGDNGTDRNILAIDADFNGTKISESTSSVQSFISTDRGQLALSSSDTQKSSRTAPQQIRIDNRYWSDEEVELVQNMYTTNHWRSLLMQTLGKRYRIADMSVSPAYANWETIQGSLILEEVDDIDGMGVAL